MTYFCKNCGKVNGYEEAIEFVNYYNNRFRIVRKSVYHKKYHIKNVFMDLSSELNTNVYADNKNKIMRIFAEIEYHSSN